MSEPNKEKSIEKARREAFLKAQSEFNKEAQTQQMDLHKVLHPQPLEFNPRNPI